MNLLLWLRKRRKEGEIAAILRRRSTRLMSRSKTLRTRAWEMEGKAAVLRVEAERLEKGGVLADAPPAGGLNEQSSSQNT